MKEKIKNIYNLSKVFLKENDNSLKLIYKKEKLNKKSLIFWLYIILGFAIIYLSSEIVDYIIKIGKPEIFLNIFLLFLNILIIIRTIMVSLNIFYFSKEIENILHLPFKSVEILISKLITILLMNYEIIALFGIIPLLIYGIYTKVKLVFFLNLILNLIIFPIFSVLIISIIMMTLMKIIKLFKNKDLMQIILSFTLIFCVMLFISKGGEYIFKNFKNISDNQLDFLNIFNEKIININKYFISINPISEILQFKNIIINYIKLILINLITFLVFIFLGNKVYLKQLLKANFYFKNKKIKNKLKIKNNNIIISFIKKEFKLLLKNPLFFIQSIYPVILNTIVFSIFISILIPQFRELLNKEEYKEMVENLKFNFETVCIILGGLQIIGLFNYTSVTAISREGKNAYLMKVLPIDLYKQIIIKNIPQIFLNTISSMIILTVIKFQIPEIQNKYILIMFIISFFMTSINSFILVLIDLLLPKINWDAEYEILKNNKNKILQYVLIIFNIVFLIYFNKVFNEKNLTKSLCIFAIVLFIILIIINILFNKYKNKLFKKIL